MSDDINTDESKADPAIEPVAEPAAAEKAAVEPASDVPKAEEPVVESKADNAAKDEPAATTAAPSGTDQQGRTLYTVKCSNCGKETQVPFQPSGDRPVYCRDCYMQKKNA